MSLNPATWLAKGHHVASKVEKIFDDVSKIKLMLEAIGGRLSALEDRMTRLEADERQVVTEARSAASAAATMVATSALSDTVTRLTKLEMRAEQAERKTLPPA